MKVSTSWMGGGRQVRAVVTLEPAEVGCRDTRDVEDLVRRAMEELVRRAAVVRLRIAMETSGR